MNKKVFFALAVLILVILACTFTPGPKPTPQPAATAGSGTTGQQTVPFSPGLLSATSSPTLAANTGTSVFLDYDADPLYGLANLQRGFTPDPHILGVGAGGTSDTSDINLACGFTTCAPTVVFNLSGGASEGFLRIYFVSSDAGMDATLVVHTPDQGYLCVDNSSYGSGQDPVIDIEYAASGKYAVWVGMHQSDTYAPGMLYITQSADNTP